MLTYITKLKRQFRKILKIMMLVSLAYASSIFAEIADDEVDLSFDVGVFGRNQTATVDALAEQTNGKLLIGGRFQYVNGLEYFGLLRLNANGTVDTSFSASLDNEDTSELSPARVIKVTSDDQLLIGGNFLQVNGMPLTTLVRLDSDGSVDTDFATNIVDVNVNGDTRGRVSDLVVQSDGKIIITGDFRRVDGVVRDGLARLNSDGSLDTSFAPPTISGAVNSLALQEDGKVIAGGSFNFVGSQPWFGLARFNTDGSLDSAYNPAPENSIVRDVVVDSDGKALIGGFFENMAGAMRPGLARLNTDGSIDDTFVPNTNSGTDKIVLLNDGRLLISGQFSMIDGVAVTGFAKLKADGTLDDDAVEGGSFGIRDVIELTSGNILVGGSFSTGEAPRDRLMLLDEGGAVVDAFNLGNFEARDGEINNIAVQANDDVVIVGLFDRIDGVSRNSIARVDRNGDVDLTFDPNPRPDSLSVFTVAVQNDQKIIVAGNFFQIGGKFGPRLARLLPDGTADPDFTADSVPFFPFDVVIQSDGKILLSGFSGIARYLSNGVTDSEFVVTTDASIDRMAIQPNGQILIAGEFSTINGVARDRIARLNADGSLDATFNPAFAIAGRSPFEIRDIFILENGKLLIGGSFDSVDGNQSQNLVILDQQGDFDSQLNSELDANQSVSSLVQQQNGDILVGAIRRVFGNQPLTRHQLNGTTDTEFSPDILGRVNKILIPKNGEVLVAGDFRTNASDTRYNIVRLGMAEPDEDICFPIISASGNVSVICL